MINDRAVWTSRTSSLVLTQVHGSVCSIPVSQNVSQTSRLPEQKLKCFYFEKRKQNVESVCIKEY